MFLSKLKKFIRADKEILNDPILDDLQHVLRFYYCWPEQKRFHWRMIFNWTQTFVIQWIPSMIFICRTKDFKLGMETFCEMVGLSLYLIQAALIAYHQQGLNDLIKKMREFWYRLNRERPFEWDETNRKHQTFIKKATKFCIGAFVTVGVIYIHCTAIVSFILKARGIYDEVYMGMHWDIFTKKIYTDWCYIIPFYLVASVSFAFFVPNYSSVGFFIPFMTKQVAVAFSSIQIRITDLARNANGMSKKEMKQRLKRIIAEHNEVIKFANDIEEAFNKMYFFKSGLASMFICFILFSIFQLDQTFYDLIKVGTFGVIVQMELFINFFIGDKLTEESENIADAAYDFPWYESDKEIGQMIIMIIHRAHRPIQLTAGKFQPISIYSYGRILNGAYSYLTFLRTMFQKK